MKTTVILGAGPAGAVLATLLAERGHEVVLFDDGCRPELIVGESLIPAVVPVLRRLGVEEKVAAIGVYKPGASFVLSPENQIDFDFQRATACGLPPYSYNVPRDLFDQILVARAREAGVHFVSHRATVERVGTDQVRLTPETLAAAPILAGRAPDRIVDATGRRRLLAKTLEIPARVGSRKDVAYFAHFTGCTEMKPRGQIAIGRLADGWSWRIPLRDRLSLGVVLPKEAAARLGKTPEDRLHNAILADPVLTEVTKSGQRMTGVATYTNYQLISERGFGPGWVALGDAFGFVDPMLSPGLWLALYGAEFLADHWDDPAAYEAEMIRQIEAWMDLISYYYDGRMFSTYFTGIELERRYGKMLTQLFRSHVESHIACMASGGTTTAGYDRGLIRFLTKHMISGSDPTRWAIR